MRPPRNSGSLPGAGKLAGLAALIRAARQFFRSQRTVYQDPVSLAKQSASTIKLNRAYQKVRAERTAQLRMELEARRNAAMKRLLARSTVKAVLRSYDKRAQRELEARQQAARAMQ